MIDICLLGSSGTMPTKERALTSLIIKKEKSLIMIDCGEGVQINAEEAGWGLNNIDLILFTHYHGDHILGLPGLLMKIAHAERVKPLKLAGPKGLAYFWSVLQRLCGTLPFEVEIEELPVNASFEYNGLLVKTLPLRHSVPCYAYSFETSRKPRFDIEKAVSENIPKHLWSKLQKGSDIIFEDRLLTPDMVLSEARKGLKVTYCTDTQYFQEISDFAKNSDLFICEGMYGSAKFQDKADKNKHMTFSEAATLAKKAEAKELWLTHFSHILKVPQDYLGKAAKIFGNTIIGKDLLFKSLNYDVE